jgi:putative transposase
MKGLKRWLKVAEDIRRNVDIPQCKHCQSRKVVRYGHSKYTQRWLCKDCGHTFVDNKALAGMKTPVEHIATALNSYYSGMSLNAIRRHLYQLFRNHPSDSTIYEWILRFSKKAVEEARQVKLDVGDVWVADETALNIDRTHRYWLWDIIDAKTRFLLATHLSRTRNIKDAQALMSRASERAGKTPKIVITDKLPAYLDGIELTFGADTKHIPIKGLKAEINTNIIERFHGTLKDRTKVMRGLKNKETAKLFLEGWLVHYNFFRPHESLNDKTPAEKAGIKFGYKNWLDVVRKPTTRPVIDKTPFTQKTPVIKESIPRDVKRLIGMEQNIPNIFR